MSSLNEEFVRSISARIEEAKRSSQGNTSDWHVIFLLGDARYALPMSAVREILRTPPLTPVPGARGYVQGVFSNRGNIIPVIDLAKRFQDKGDTGHVPEHVVIIEFAGALYGFLVDRVIDARAMEGKNLRAGMEPSPGHIPSPYLLGAWDEEETESIKPFRYEFFIASPKFRELVREDIEGGKHAVSTHLLALPRMIEALEADMLSDRVIQ